MARKRDHIIDILLEERAVKLSQHVTWPILRPMLNFILGYRHAVKMADAVRTMTGPGVMDHVAGALQLDMKVNGLEHLPRTGSVVLAPNHPTGIADGIAIFAAIRDVRPDAMIFANRDAIRAAPPLEELIIPVEWRNEHKSRARSRQTLVQTNHAFKAHRALVLFPSGRLAMMNDAKALVEHPWMTSVAALPKKFGCPIIPVRISSRNSWLYYLFWNINTELRDMTLFHELLNKRGQRFEITFGAPIMPESLPDDNTGAAAMLRGYVTEALGQGETWGAYQENWHAAAKKLL